MRTIATIIASVTMLTTLALPAVASAATKPPRASETAIAHTDNAYAAFDGQAPTSATELNEHVYHGGPKVND
jgi:hypothetical protein